MLLVSQANNHLNLAEETLAIGGFEKILLDSTKTTRHISELLVGRYDPAINKESKALLEFLSIPKPDLTLETLQKYKSQIKDPAILSFLKQQEAKVYIRSGFFDLAKKLVKENISFVYKNEVTGLLPYIVPDLIFILSWEGKKKELLTLSETAMQFGFIRREILSSRAMALYLNKDIDNAKELINLDLFGLKGLHLFAQAHKFFRGNIFELSIPYYLASKDLEKIPGYKIDPVLALSYCAADKNEKAIDLFREYDTTDKDRGYFLAQADQKLEMLENSHSNMSIREKWNNLLMQIFPEKTYAADVGGKRGRGSSPIYFMTAEKLIAANPNAKRDLKGSVMNTGPRRRSGTVARVIQHTNYPLKAIKRSR